MKLGINYFAAPFIGLLTLAIALWGTPAWSKVPVNEVVFHNEQADTTIITYILVEIENIADPGERILATAYKFVGKPYVPGTLENADGERLVVNLDEFDCTTFVETVMALCITAAERRTSWRDYLATLESLRYRGAQLDGYPSRLHYMSDWIVDNSHRGNIQEVTDRWPESRTQEKTLDFMSRNADKYPALADSANLARIKSYEMGYRRHRFPYLPYASLNSRTVRDKLNNGDMVAILSKAGGLDVQHVGFIVKDSKNTPYIIHASSKDGCVEVSKQPLGEYLKKQMVPGIRIIRLKE